MTEPEVVANGESEAAAAEAAPAPPAEKLKRLPKPDDTEYTAKFEKLNEQINAKNARLGEIKEALDAYHDKRKAGSGEQVELRNKLNDEKARFQSVLAKKAETKAQLERINKHRDELRGAAKSTKDKNQYMKTEDIDEKVKKLQHKLEHTSLTLNEEKQVLTQLKDLEKSRTTLAQYAEQMDKMSNSNDLREQVIEELKSHDAELQSIKDFQKELQDNLSALRDKESATLPNVPSLMAERKECYEVIKAAKAAKSQLYNERKAALDEFYTREREVKRQIYEERKVKAEQRRKEWEERQKERKAREDAEKGEPFEDEIVLCDQMASYLTGFLPKASAAPEAAAASSSSAAAAPEAGMKLVKKKGEDEEVDAMFTGLGGKKGAKGKGAKKAAKKAEEKKDTSLAKLPHSIDTLSAFSKLKVEVPVNATNIPTAIEALKAAKEDFLKKREVEKERRAKAAEAGEEEEEEAAPSGDAEEDEEEEEAAKEDGEDSDRVKVSLSVGGMNGVELTLEVPKENGA